LSPAPAPHLYALSLHDALPIFREQTREVDAARDCFIGPGTPVDHGVHRVQLAGEPHTHIDTEMGCPRAVDLAARLDQHGIAQERDRKSTRLNSSHVKISYAVFC